MNIQSWPHQIKAREMLTEAFRAGKRAPILLIATGGGKTHTFCGFVDSATKKGRKVLVVVHRLELLLACSKKLDEFGIAHGLISPHYKQTTDEVQVASVQTLVRRLDKFPWTPDIIVVDECHLSVAPTFKKVFAKWPNAFILGTTATAGRLDQKGLGKHCGGHYDAIVEPTSMAELIAGGYLVKPIAYAPSTPDLRGVRTMMGDYDQAATEKIMDKPKLTGDVVEHYLKIARGRPTIAFCVSIAHAEHVAEQFRAAGVRAKAISGETDTEERLDAIRALGDKRLDVVVNCSLLIEGVDQPAVSCIILLAPTQSLTRYLQSVGRGLRKHPGKKDCIILDHAAACFTHGFVDDARAWSLDGTKKEKRKADDDERVAKCKMCQSCYAMNPNYLSKCEQCGNPFEIRARAPEQRDGELHEVTDADKEAIRRQRKDEIRSARTREQLEVIAKQRGFKRGWIDFVIKAREEKSRVKKMHQM